MNTDRRLLEDELIGHGDELMPRPFGAAPGGRSGRGESFTTLVPDSILLNARRAMAAGA